MLCFCKNMFLKQDLFSQENFANKSFFDVVNFVVAKTNFEIKLLSLFFKSLDSVTGPNFYFPIDSQNFPKLCNCQVSPCEFTHILKSF